MADTRKDKRAPISLKVRFKSATLDEFIEQYSGDISRGEMSEFVAHFAGDDRNVADYLIGEALARVSDADQDFLGCTSVLDQMTGPLCDAVAGITGSAEILERNVLPGDRLDDVGAGDEHV